MIVRAYASDNAGHGKNWEFGVNNKDTVPQIRKQVEDTISYEYPIAKSYRFTIDSKTYIYDRKRGKWYRRK